MEADRKLWQPKGTLVGKYGDATTVAQFVLNAKGQILGAANVPIAFPPSGGGGGGTAIVPIQSFGLEIGDGVNPIAPGYQGMYVAPFTGRLTGWSIISVDPNLTAGAIVVDVLKIPFDLFPQPSGTSVTGATPPTITSGHKGAGQTTDWVADVVFGDVYIFDVPSVSGFTKVLLQLRGEQLG